MTALFLALGLGLGVTACGDTGTGDGGGDGGNGGGGGAQSAVCADLDALRASLGDLEDVGLDQGGLSDLTAELSDIRSQLDELAADAKDEYSSEVDELRARADDLTASLEAASGDPSVDSLAEVRTGIQAFGSAVKDLGDAVAGC